jgi:hypothetical protein
MQKIDKHISNLLDEHDCVIVPEFGGFVANYSPAKIHPVQHTFTPPAKNIVFNKNLKNNDGLLANHISMESGASYPEALKYIEHFVERTNISLKNGSKVKIEEVGTLFLDVERNIQFEPDAKVNHLLDAFGLAQFQSPAIKRDNIGKRIEKEFKDRGAIPAEKKKINVKRYVALALAMPLIFGMIWIPLKTDLLKNINYSDLNPFASKEVVKPELKNKSDDTAKKIEIPKDTTSVQMATTTIESKTVAEQLIQPIAADTTRVVKSAVNPENKFHLVAGCFQIEENAIKFVAMLQKQNIGASIIGQNDKGLYVVSCGDYSTRKEAGDELQNLRKLQPDAWLYKN